MTDSNHTPPDENAAPLPGRAYRRGPYMLRKRLHHGLTRVTARNRRKERIDIRFREGKEAVAFRARLIESKGGIDNMTPQLAAVADILTSKYYRLLQVWKYLYGQPAPPIVNKRTKRVNALWHDLDSMEEGFVRTADRFGFGRAVRQIDLDPIARIKAQMKRQNDE